MSLTLHKKKIGVVKFVSYCATEFHGGYGDDIIIYEQKSNHAFIDGDSFTITRRVLCCTSDTRYLLRLTIPTARKLFSFSDLNTIYYYKFITRTVGTLWR